MADSSSDSNVPSFDADIKPLFRDRDVNAMIAVADLNLRSYEDVKAHANDILSHLKTDMPCDRLWPEDRIAKFEAWKDGGMPA